MEKIPTAPRVLDFSTRLYEGLLMIYPTEFRRVYREPMLQVFRDCCRRALSESGIAGLLAFWGRTILDTLQTALEEHSHRGIEMNIEKFIKLCGWSLMLGPILFLIGAWAKSRPPYVPYAISSLPIDRYAIPAGTPLIVIGLALMSLGMIGMLVRFTPKLNSASVLLGIGAISGLASAVGAILLAIKDSSPGWNLFILGLAGQYLALAIFGFITLRRRLLPRWNGLPVLALWFPVLLLLSMGVSPWEISSQVFAALWLLGCMIFAGLGYLLQSDSQAIGRSAATP